MSDENDDDLPPECFFFKRRAQIVPHVSPEKFKTIYEELTKTEEKELELEKNTKPNKTSNKKASTKAGKKKAEPAKKEAKEVSENENEDINENVKLPRAVMRRLKKQQQEREFELKMIERDNERVLAATEFSDHEEVNEVLPAESENKSVILTVSYLSKISRIRCFENDKFATIFPKVAELYDLRVSELLFCFREQNITVEDTPKSLNLSLCDTIECIPYITQDTDKENLDENKLKLIFQSSDSKQKIDILVHKLETMQEIMTKYANLRSIPLENLIFEFDGEKIEGTETPNDLDMESGHCIDVKVVEKPNKRKSTPTKRRGRKAKKNVSPVVVTVNSDDSRDSDVILL